MKKFICNSCGKEFESKKACKNRTPKYCSSKCFGKTLELNIKCQKCGEKIENKNSSSIRHRKFCSKKCQTEARKGNHLSAEWRKALSEARLNSKKSKGENLYNWKGGKETLSIRVKESFYKRKKSLRLKMPIDFLKAVLVAQDNKCFFCETDLSEYKAIEHLTPVSRGGDNYDCNLVYSCKSCNSQKHQQTLEEFAINTDRLYLLDKFDEIYATAINTNI